MVIRIVVSGAGQPKGKVADAALVFGSTDGPLEGLKLEGFSVWETRGNGGTFNVTFPARQYTVNGERRSFALLRPSDNTGQRLKEAIILAYAAAIDVDESVGFAGCR